MKRLSAAIVVGIIVAVSAVTLSEPATQLPVQDDEIPAIVVNSGEKTALKLTVFPPKVVKVGKACQFRVEIANTGARVEVVYMPALTASVESNWPPQKGDPGPVTKIVEGWHQSFGRGCAKDERLNYVVLWGGDIYARTYTWTPPAVGEATFDAVYRNAKNGEEIGILAWTGRLEAGSDALKINE